VQPRDRWPPTEGRGANPKRQTMTETPKIAERQNEGMALISR